MRMVLLGGPGAGKGTQAVMLSQRLNVPHVSTGDIFRSNIKNGTELGRKAKEYMDKGALVPDELTVEIVRDRLSQFDCKYGFILDGFPRTIPQAEYLEDALAKMGKKLDVVLNIDVRDDVIVRRLSGRRVCSSCGAPYHVSNNPPKADGVCDTCGGSVVQRDDDREETVAKRLKTYHDQTEPLIDFYGRKGYLKTVDGEGSVEETLDRTIKALGV